ncbi:MAG: thrombospondin type 3 repeat-containing protein, partial [Anaerolineae bacterium]|nr:thrombospondin type 3 repeat-containing protein [Anaerolineae bacterium]
MHKMLFPRRAFLILCVLSLLVPSVNPTVAHTSVPEPIGAHSPVEFYENTGLFRTHVTYPNALGRQRLDQLGVVVLEEDADGALVLVDSSQLEDLARLRFNPRGSDAIGMLLQANADRMPWLAESLVPLVAQATAVEQLSHTRSLVYPAERDALRDAMQAITAEQQAGLASTISMDSDGDGLTDVQESWWCTNPLDADTDDDGKSDGVEIQVLKDWMNNKRANSPGETPWPNWPPEIPGCDDKDFDSIPNLAERWELGLNMDFESSDRDRYDDGQELFGTTYCPGSASACGYGQLPSANHDGILLFPQMPSWITAPGNHPLVAALPRIDFTIVPGANGADFVMQTATVVTTDERHEEGESKLYSTTKTDGTSTSDAETKTWENWQEYSKTTEAQGQMSLQQITAPNDVFVNSTEEYLQWNDIRTTNNINNTANVNIDNSYHEGQSSSLLDELSAPVTSFIIDEACAELNCKKYIGSGIGATVRTFVDVVQGTLLGTSDKIQDEFVANKCDTTSSNLKEIGCRLISTATLWKKNYDERLTASTTTEQEANGLMGGNYLETGDSYLDMNRIFPITFPEPRFIPTETNTTGSSTGGARTTTHTTYEEHAVTEGTTKQFGDSWGTAIAEDTLHAADLWFAYELSNTGSDYARVICDLAINIYIGDSNAPAITYYPGDDLGGDGCFSNFQPGETHKYTFPSDSRIALTLDQMAAIDLGEKVRFAIEDYSLGQDDYYADDAVQAGLIIGMDDGLEDANDDISTYIIPTWGEETVLDVVTRYFPHQVDGNGLLIAIWTPEYRTDTPTWCQEPNRVGTTLWCKHALSTADWWNIYTEGMGDGSEGFQDTPASGGSTALFRFNKDSDLDGYSDRSENKLGTNPTDPASHPRPELLAGLHSIRVGDDVTATLSLLNTGLYDAYGVEAVLLAPDGTVSITNNTVGGSGRVRAQQNVIVGSRILPPAYSAGTWNGSAEPFSAGYYTGLRDRVYTFTALQSGAVSNGTLQLQWADGLGANGTLNFGSGYASPSPLNVGTLGVQVGLLSGAVQAGDWFTVEARTPRDTFQ